eukprot:3390314-Pleurochrysis_carterae.AAC.1
MLSRACGCWPAPRTTGHEAERWRHESRGFSCRDLQKHRAFSLVCIARLNGQSPVDDRVRRRRFDWALNRHWRAKRMDPSQESESRFIVAGEGEEAEVKVSVEMEDVSGHLQE